MRFLSRASTKWIILTYLLAIAHFSSASNGDDFDLKKKALVNVYMEFAFAQNERIVKFARRPVISFFCLSSYCEGVAAEVAAHFPSKSRYTVSKSPSVNADINIMFVGSASVGGGSAYVYKRADGQSLKRWGTKSCNVVQIRRDETVEKVFIVLNESEGRLKNIACILCELPRASGGNLIGLYQEYAQTFSDYSKEVRDKFYAGIEMFLRMHWAELIPPGTDRDTTLELVWNNIQ